MKVARKEFAMAYWPVTKKLYVFGGGRAGTVTQSIESLDMSSVDEWVVMPEKLTPECGVRGMSAVALPDGIYLIGGVTINGRISSSIHRFDPINSSLT